MERFKPGCELLNPKPRTPELQKPKPKPHNPESPCKLMKSSEPRPTAEEAQREDLGDFRRVLQATGHLVVRVGRQDFVGPECTIEEKAS